MNNNLKKGGLGVGLLGAGAGAMMAFKPSEEEHNEMHMKEMRFMDSENNFKTRKWASSLALTAFEHSVFIL